MVEHMESIPTDNGGRLLRGDAPAGCFAAGYDAKPKLVPASVEARKRPKIRRVAQRAGPVNPGACERRSFTEDAPAPVYLLGLGTGRCGTKSLSRLFNAQPGVRATHEARPLQPWSPSEAHEAPIDRAARLVAEMPRDKRIYVDVALYLLPYAGLLLKHFSTAKAIVLERDRDEVVLSYQRSMAVYKKRRGLKANHWSKDRSGLNDVKFDPCYPKFPTTDLAEGIGLYWDEYHRRIGELRRRFPNRVRVWRTEDLNDPDQVIQMLTFAGVDTANRRIVHPHANRSEVCA